MLALCCMGSGIAHESSSLLAIVIVAQRHGVLVSSHGSKDSHSHSLSQHGEIDCIALSKLLFAGYRLLL
jgi:hypothetical protein